MMRVLGLLVALLLAGPAAAQEYVSVRGALADEDFYRVVACAARPGSGCQKPFLRWPVERRANLTVGFAAAAGRAPAHPSQPFENGLDSAVAQINGLAAGIGLRRTDSVPDIAIHIVPTAPGQVMRHTGIPELDGIRLPLARVTIRTRNGDIRHAVIAVSSKARPREVASLLLEEIVQGLGLITDIRGAAYRGSVFAEDSNSAIRLEGQDAMALRRHYGTTFRTASAFPTVYRSASSADGDVAPSVRLRRLGRTVRR